MGLGNISTPFLSSVHALCFPSPAHILGKRVNDSLIGSNVLFPVYVDSWEELGSLGAQRGGLITSWQLWKVSFECFAVGTIEKKALLDNVRHQERLVVIPSVKIKGFLQLIFSALTGLILSFFLMI